MWIRMKFIVGILWVMTYLPAIAQELTPVQQEYISQVIENLAEQYENSDDVAAVSDDLLTCLQDPLNLNTAGSEELAELHVLTPFQIAALIDYRKNQGYLLSVYELLYIPGFRQQEVDLIMPFVVCGEPDRQHVGVRELRGPIKQQVIIRYQRVLEEQKGFEPIPNSVLENNPDKSRYLGAPGKVYFRYRIDMGGKLRAGLLAEKDAGEEFFRGSNLRGFDFYSGYIEYKEKNGILQHLVLGDYHIRMGQGLLAWSSYAYGKSPYVSDLYRTREVIKVNSSAEENRLLRGSAITLSKYHFSFTAFVSLHTMDATVVSDSASPEQYFTSFGTTGYHTTPSEIQKENAVKLSSFGGCLRYDYQRLKLGFNAVSEKTDGYLLKPDELYKAWYPTGREHYGISADYRYLAKKYQIFGEAAYNGNAFALLNGILLYLKPELNLGILHRHYETDYYAFWADAFRENSAVAGEDGLFMGLEGSYTGNRFRFYSDVFSFPWLRYRVNAPSDGYEVFGEWEKSWGEACLYFRYKRQEKPVNCGIEENLYRVLPQIKEQYRLNGSFPVNTHITLQSRIEISRAGFREDTLHTGFLVYQDILLRSLTIPVDISMRIGYFNAEDYETRIYAYERDLLYAASSQMHYGKGWRYMLLLKWQPGEKVGFWLKIGQTRYPGSESIGSGLTEISGNHRTEVKVQVIVKL